MSLSRQIAVGLLAGVALGLFLGEIVAPIQFVGDAYVRLLQMAVLPYVTVSLVAGLGSLDARRATLLLTRVGLVVLALWATTLAFAFLMPLSFPEWQTASFFSTSLLERPEAFDFLGLYIPSNPFHSLANNVVPAVVLFSIVVGAALIGLPNKEPLLAALETASRALARVNQLVARLTPYGLFAIGAHIAGTLRLEELERIEVYLVAYTAAVLALGLWAFPTLVRVLTPVGYRELMGPARDALLTAFMTGSLFVVLPALGDCARALLRRHLTDDPDAEGLPEIVVPASFNFPHAGKVLTLSFIPFAAWFAETPLTLPQYPLLAGAGLLSFFGSLNAAVPYLLDLFRIPQDTFQLFLATSALNSRLGSALAAMHTLVVAVLGGFALSGRLTLDRKRLLRFAVALVVVAGGGALGLRLLFEKGIAHRYDRDQVVAGMERLREGVDDAVVHREFPPIADETALGADQIERIRTRGRLRVGYATNNPPYSYFNARDALVGLDVELAHDLARELGTGLEFVPVRLEELVERARKGEVDLVMSGIPITPERAAAVTFTMPYLEETIGFVVDDHLRSKYATREAVRARPGVRLGVPNVPWGVAKVKEYAPEADVQVLSQEEMLAFLEGKPSPVEALVFGAQRGSLWSLRRPQLCVVVPDPPLLTVPLAFPVGRSDARLAAFLNAWIELKKRDGSISALNDYWVLGKHAEKRRPRWSILRALRGDS